MIDGGFTVTISQLKNIIRDIYASEDARDTGIALWGPPGMGKTQLFEQIGEELKARVKVFLTATMDPTDVVGVPHPVDGITKFLPPESFHELTVEAEDKGPMVALFDDMPACQEQVFAALFRVIQQREVAGLKIRDNVLLCATGNRVEDKAGASDLPTALANRFVHFSLAVNNDEWRHWAIAHDVVEEIVAFIRTNGKQLHNFDPNSGFLAFPTPRSVAKASDLVKAIGYDKENDLRVSLIGCCGEGWGTEFMAFLKVRHKLIPPQDIVKDPEGCRLPAEADIDVMFATITSLTYHVKRNPKIKDAIACLTYATRLPHKEMGINLARDIVMSIVMNSNDTKFRAGVLGSKEFSEMMPEFRKYLKASNN